MAYGKVGSPPKIPPDAVLTFDIELLEIAAR
jgi:FKBP-type peptidyl-prolyl cis-trans isomerase